MKHERQVGVTTMSALTRDDIPNTCAAFSMPT